jgi:acyl-CoA thioesterase FadM
MKCRISASIRAIRGRFRSYWWNAWECADYSPRLAAQKGHPAGMSAAYAKFETELQDLPDDIDMFNHVHSSRYMDYVQAARYAQMAGCYGMSWEDFIKLGFGWYLVATQLGFKRPLALGDRFVVRTWVVSFRREGVKIGFEIDRADTGKRSCDGWADYTMITLATGRATPIPDDIKARYSIAVAK